MPAPDHTIRRSVVALSVASLVRVDMGNLLSAAVKIGVYRSGQNGDSGINSVAQSGTPK
jgi:hypothetical protein